MNDNLAVRILDYDVTSTGTVLNVMQLGSDKTVQCGFANLGKFHITNPSFITKPKAKEELKVFLARQRCPVSIVSIENDGKVLIKNSMQFPCAIDDILGFDYIENLSSFKSYFPSKSVKHDSNFMVMQQFEIFTQTIKSICDCDYEQDVKNPLRGTFKLNKLFNEYPGVEDSAMLEDYYIKANISIATSKDYSKVKILDIKSWISATYEGDKEILGGKKFTPFKEAIGKLYSLSDFETFMKDKFYDSRVPRDVRHYGYSDAYLRDPKYQECLKLIIACTGLGADAKPTVKPISEMGGLRAKIAAAGRAMEAGNSSSDYSDSTVIFDETSLKKYIQAIEYVTKLKYVPENGNFLKGEFQQHTLRPAYRSGIPVGFWEYDSIKVEFSPDYKEMHVYNTVRWLRSTEHMRLADKKVQTKQGYSEYSIPHDAFGIDNQESAKARPFTCSSDLFHALVDGFGLDIRFYLGEELTEKLLHRTFEPPKRRRYYELYM